MRPTTLRFLSSLLLCAAVAGCSSRTTVSSLTPEVSHAARQEEKFPYPVVTLSGDGTELGTEHGQRFGSSIRELHQKYFGLYFRNEVQRLLALTAANRFEGLLRPEHQAEVKALAKESAVEERQMMLAQCFLDITAMTACSTVTLPAEASPDGVARFGRNLDFPSFDIADKSTVVLAYHPKDKFSFVSIGWPGLIGVLSGMNEHGLSIANMEVNRGMRLPSAMPYTLLYRTVLEECRTTDEAIALLEKTPRQSANNLMVMDAAGNRAVLEITPDKVTVRRGEPGTALLSTNHQRGQDTDTPGRCTRYDCMHAATAQEFGRIDRTSLQSILRAASSKKFTLQSMIFEPATRTIYLSAGENAAAGTFHRLDVKQVLGGVPAATPTLP